MPFLSIIVPIYNAEQYLEECLDSILAQTFTDYEVILVDDGSTDRSGAICEQYKDKSNVIRVIHKENGGLVSARKSGIAVAKGKYIGYVDSDDVIAPEMYQDLCNSAMKNGVDIVICDVWQWEEEKKIPLEQRLEGGIYTKEQLIQNIYSSMFYAGTYYKFGFLPAMWNKIYKADIVRKNQMLVDDEIRIGEDAACSYLCILDADIIQYQKGKYYYYYRYNAESMCHNWTNSNIESAVKLLDYLYERLSDYKYCNIMQQFWYYYSYMFTNMLYEYGEAVRKKQINKNASNDFKVIMESKSFKAFLVQYKNLKIPFYRKIVADSMIYNRTIENLLWKTFVRLRALIKKLK